MLLSNSDLQLTIDALDECITQKKSLAAFYGSKGKNKAAAELQLHVIELEHLKRKFKETLINNDAPVLVPVIQNMA